MSGKNSTDSDDEKQPEKRRPGRSRKKDRPLTKKEVEQISSLWFKGRTAAQISKRTKIDQAAIEREITKLEDRSLAGAQREMDRAEKLRELGFEAHHVSVHQGLTDRERRAQLRKFKAAIKETLPEAFECDVTVAKLLETGGDDCWLRVAGAATECRARIKALSSGDWDESATATLEDLEREFAEWEAEREAEEALPAEQKRRRREIRKSDPSEN